MLAVFNIFDPNKLPDNSDSLAEYGNTDITTLSDQFQGVVASTGECVEEWIGYCQFLQNVKCTAEHSTTHRDAIKDLCSNATTAALFPNISRLAKICRVVPIHTADVERTFSQLKLIKTRTRN